MHDGQTTPIAYASKHGDFIACMTDAPWVQILVVGADVLCFGMKDGLWQSTHTSLRKAPHHLQDFVVSHMSTVDRSEEELRKDRLFIQALQTDGQAVDFEEIALLAGKTVTLVGKLCRGPGGQLSLQRWQDGEFDSEGITKEGLRKESSFGQTSSEGSGSIPHPEDEWKGKILACDDPSYISRRK